MRFPDKTRVLEGIVAALSGTLAQLAKGVAEIRQGATHAEAKPENDKDTRALEQSYLARGQAMRAEALADELVLLRSLELSTLGPDDIIRAGALIALEDDDGTRCVFLAPHGGGVSFEVDGVAVTVVTPVSALGRALLGRQVGDDVEVRVRNSVRTLSIVAIA